MTSAVQSQPGPYREVLRGADRDAAVRAAAAWYASQPTLQDALSSIAERFNLSMTASGEAILLAEREDAPDATSK